jgi:hypothetical protein
MQTVMARGVGALSLGTHGTANMSEVTGIGPVTAKLKLRVDLPAHSNLLRRSPP